MKTLLLSYCKSRQFKEQLANNRTRLYRIAYSWSHSHDIADDLVQDAMGKALKNYKQLRDHGALNSWLFGILNNCWRDYLRQRHDFDNIDDIVLISHDTPDKHFERQDLSRIIQDHMEQLNIGQRQVISLVDLHGCTYEEVSQILSIPIGTVMSRLSRARKQLAEALIEYKPVNTVHNPKNTLRSVV